MARVGENPFTPGAGLPPPLRAGHEKIIRELETRLGRICAKGIGDMAVLYGPRGNGKTALLPELLEKAEKKKAETRVLTEETMVGGAEEVARYIRFGDEEPKRKVRGAGVSLPGVGGGGMDYEQSAAPTVRVALHTLLKKKPVVLAVDEAHVMPVEFGRSLLQTAQHLISRRMRLLLVLAGTPGVCPNLRSMGASFWERCKRLRVSRLESEDDVRRAIAIPAKQAGFPVDEDALALLVKESQGYPFFIQLLAAAPWDAAVARGGAKGVGLRDAQAGVATAEADRRDFYWDRYFEADKQGVLATATAVSREMAARGTSPMLGNHELKEVLEAATSGSKETAQSACEKLLLLGFIWFTPAGDWMPGIPSLCTFFVEQARKATKKRT